MKKLFLVSLVLGSFMFTSCNRNTSTSNKNTSSSKVESSQPISSTTSKSIGDHSTGILPSISDSISQMMS